MPHPRAFDPAPRTGLRTAPCPSVAGRNPMQLIRIGYGLTLLSSLLAFVMRAS
jgi:hypothetical protein